MKNFLSSQKINVSYDVYGDPSSKQAILFFHGFPGSHLQGAFLNEKLKSLQMMMVAVDRPGYGDSSWVNPNDWSLATKAYQELLASMGHQKFSVMAVSGGAPMAHMTAHYLNTQIQRLIVVCGLASFSKQTKTHFSSIQRKLLFVSKLLPVSFLRLLLDKGMGSFQPEKRLSHLIQTLHETDQKVLSAPQNQGLLLESMKWARNQGSRGVVWDSQIFCQDWLNRFCDSQSFKKFPTFYFHGEKDFLLNPGMSQDMQQMVSGSTVMLIENQGHYSVPLVAQEKIFSELIKNKKTESYA
jgi:pimeloyl-ACP methyl ester carboxylesterase